MRAWSEYMRLLEVSYHMGYDREDHEAFQRFLADPIVVKQIDRQCDTVDITDDYRARQRDNFAKRILK